MARIRTWTNKQLTSAVRECETYSCVLRKLGLTVSGGNYEHVKKYIELLKLDTTHMLGQAWAKGKTFVKDNPKLPDTKECTRCKKELSIDSFSWKVRAKNRKSCWCRECTRQYNRVHYRGNKKTYKHNAKKSRVRTRKRVRKFLADYLKTHTCVDCGESDVLVLEFDHLEYKHGNRSGPWSASSVGSCAEELLTCEVRCANCHTRRHRIIRKNNKELVRAHVAERNRR